MVEDPAGITRRHIDARRNHRAFLFVPCAIKELFWGDEIDVSFPISAEDSEPVLRLRWSRQHKPAEQTCKWKQEIKSELWFCFVLMQEVVRSALFSSLVLTSYAGTFLLQLKSYVTEVLQVEHAQSCMLARKPVFHLVSAVSGPKT